MTRGDIDNNCSNYLTSNENNNGYNIAMNYHNDVYDRVKLVYILIVARVCHVMVFKVLVVAGLTATVLIFL